MGIFKAYDIRGTYPDQLNEELAYRIGKAFVSLLKCRNVVIGRDMRLSSDKIFASLAKGITEMGADAIDIGMCTTPMMYFAVGKKRFDSGIMITASHNPARYNGFKMVRADAVPISGETGIYEMEKLVNAGRFEMPKKKGTIRKHEGILSEYVDSMLAFSNPGQIKPMSIVVDSANAMASPMVEKFFSRLPVRLTHLYSQLDGTFPNHEANPLVMENLKDLQEEVKKQKADLGIAFDGDADRVAFVDEKGNPISCDLITALVAQAFLKENPGETMLYDLRSSWAVKEAIEEKGGKSVMCKVGHSLIKAQMRELNARFAGELSGHYYLKDVYYTEVPLIVVIKLLELISGKDKSISGIIGPLQRYFATGEINSEVKDKDAKMKELATIYRDARSIFWLDGVSVEYDDWWFNVRPSNTEPLLRLNLEAKSRELMGKKRDEILQIIRK